MSETIFKTFDHKICRSCGQSFIGENVVCDSCLESFASLEEELKQHEHSEVLRHCRYCGRPFIGGYYQRRKETVFFQPTIKSYCKGIVGDQIHYAQCQNCGGAIKESTASGDWPKKVGCSRKCTNAVWQFRKGQTCLERYGFEDPTQSEEVKAKKRATCLERYGVEYVLCKGPKRDEIDASIYEKYGVRHMSQIPEVRAKVHATWIRNHGGVGFASASQREKCKATSLKKYGTEYPHQSEEVKAKIRQSTRLHFGVDHVMQSPEHRERLIRQCRENFGVDWKNQLPEYIEASKHAAHLRHAETIEDLEKRQNYLEFVASPEKFLQSHFSYKPTLPEVQESIGGLDSSTIYGYLGVGNASMLLSRNQTWMEREIQNHILSLDPNIVISMNNRTIIHPKEVDIYLPEYKIAIECNPTATHNSSITYKELESEKPTPITYHQLKSDMCEKQNIFLLHVFGYEWSLKSEIIKSMISNLLGKSATKYYARNLEVREVSNSICTEFLNINHRQGATNAKVRLGLFSSDGTLVSMMTFNKMRMSMGAKKSDTENTWELSRFCSLLNTSVVGGASKLFKHFLRNYKYDKVVSFSDRAHTRGTLYETLGFEKVNVSSPNYVWVDYDTDMYYNRVTCQKQNLPKLFNEPDLDIENQTEKMIMMSHGFVQVFDSGTVRWEYTKC